MARTSATKVPQQATVVATDHPTAAGGGAGMSGDEATSTVLPSARQPDHVTATSPNAPNPIHR